MSKVPCKILKKFPVIAYKISKKNILSAGLMNQVCPGVHLNWNNKALFIPNIIFSKISTNIALMSKMP